MASKAGALGGLQGLNRGFFNMEEQPQPIELPVTGEIPKWINGNLYRIGPGKYTIPYDKPTKQASSFEIQHWFDGLAQTHRFEIKNGKVTHRSKDTAAGQEAIIRKQGGNDFILFGQDPCKSTLGKLMNFFKSDPPMTDPSSHNVSVTISNRFPMPHKAGGGKKLVAKTDANLLQLLDPETLEPLELFKYDTVDKRLKGELAPAHACFFDGAMYSFVLALMGRPTYTIFEVRETGVKVLATIKDLPANYIHSLQATEKYIILTCWECKLSPLTIPYYQNIRQCMRQPTGALTVFCVIDRINGGLVAKYEGPSFFCFHTINSFDDDDGSIVIDLATYKDWTIINELTLAHLREGIAVNAVAHRFRLPAPSTSAKGKPTKVDVEYKKPEIENIELMSVNPNHYHRKYRYTYGCNHQEGIHSVFSHLVKLDMSSAGAQPVYWEPAGHSSVGEPIFVPRPDATEEDDGVLMTVVFTEGHSSSALVFVDAKTMKEIARAEAKVCVPFGFHGSFDPVKAHI